MFSEAAKTEQSLAKSVCKAPRFSTFHNNLLDLTQKLIQVENFCLYITDTRNLVHILHVWTGNMCW